MGGSLPHSLYTAEQSRKLEAEAIQQHGVSGIELMRRAGLAAFDVLVKNWPQISRGGSLQILCGSGNNGGDGYVIAALARQRYIPVRVITLENPEDLTGDARRAWEWYRSTGGLTQPWSDDTELTGDLIIDAMIGIGLSREVTGDYAAAIHAVNASGKPVMALDVPSGLSVDSGTEQGVAIQADLTITFVGMKRGLVTGAGKRVCGHIICADLNLSPEIFDSEPVSVKLLTESEVAQYVAPRARDAHKGHYGHLLVVGGDYGMGGAAIMAAEAALRCGVGRVTLATRAEHVTACLVRSPEVMVQVVDSGADIQVLLADKSAVVIGPGLGQSTWGRELLCAVLASDLPLLLDADALNMIAETPGLMTPRENCIITPHLGEAARLLGGPVVDVAEHRFAAVDKLQLFCGGVVVLKGAGTLIASMDDDQGCTYICNAGNPGMAVAGMGDVLSGITGALLAQGINVAQAARLGVWLHASAGDDCAKRQGETGIAATDLIPAVRRLLNHLTDADRGTKEREL